MKARSWVVPLAALVVAACQTPPPIYHVEQMRTYAKPKATVWNEILAFLERSRIGPATGVFAAGRLEAERHDFQDMGWADCERAWVIDHSSNSARRTRASPVARDLRLEIVLEQATGTTKVTALARFTDQQINPYRNLPFAQSCRSKGVLERALFDAL